MNSLVLAPDRWSDSKCCILHHGSQNGWHRQEWRNYITVTLCILHSTQLIKQVAQLSMTNPCDALHHSRQQNF